MKSKILLFFSLLLLNFLANSQENAQYLGGPTTAVKVRGRLYVDSILTLPGVSNFIPLKAGALRYEPTAQEVQVWDGTQWVSVAAGGVTVAWGNITGTLSDQADLQAALDGKQATLTTGTASQYLRGDLTLGTFATDVQAVGDPRYAALVHPHVAADVTDFTTAARNVLSAGSGISYNPATGVIAATAAAGGGYVFQAPMEENDGTVSMPQAGSAQSGFLTAQDWNYFWNAHQDRITSASFSGVGTKTLTLYQLDGGTITASFTDENSGTAGANTLDELTDVTLTAPQTGHLLRFNAGTSQWENFAPTYLTSETDPQWTAAAPNYYTKTNLQTAGQATVDWGNIANEPTFLTAETDPQFDTKFAAKSTTNLSEGTNLYFTEGRVRATVLTGYAVGTNTALAATDNILAAMGKIQAQLNNKQASGSYLTTETDPQFDTKFSAKSTTNLAEGTNLYYTDARVRAATLTGYALGTNTALAATDNILGAMGKIQAQLNAKQASGTYLTAESDPVYSGSPAASITTTDKTNWTAGYNDRVTAVGVSGTTSKTLTLTQSDGGTVSTTYTDQVGPSDLNGLTDVTIATVANAQLLRYNSTTAQWENWTPNFLTAEVDGSTSNELQTLSVNGTQLTISSGNTVSIPGDGNNYPTALSWNTLGDGVLELGRNGLTVLSVDLDGRYLQAEVDGSTSNELQTLSLVGTTLSISSGNSVSIPQDGNNYPTSLTFAGGTLTLGRNGTTDLAVSLDGRYLTSEVDGSTSNELQTLSVAGQNLTISGGNTVALPSGGATTLDGLNDVTIAAVANTQLLRYNSTTAQWENWTPNYLTGEVDGSTSNELQSLSVSGDQLTISAGNTITLPTYSTLQAVTNVGNTTTNEILINTTDQGTYMLQVGGDSYLGGYVFMGNSTSSIGFDPTGGSMQWYRATAGNLYLYFNRADTYGALMGVANGNNSIITGSIDGDFVIRSGTGSDLMLGNNSTSWGFKIAANKLYFNNLSVYADNAAAVAAGAPTGQVYRTSTGQLMIVY